MAQRACGDGCRRRSCDRVAFGYYLRWRPQYTSAFAPIALVVDFSKFLLASMRRLPGSFNAAGGVDCDAWWVEALRCLLVDDNPEFLETARRLLEQQGISVVGIAANSAEAVERAAELQPDVVLIDVHLGKENGLQLARRIAGLEREDLPRVNSDLELSGRRPGRCLADRTDDGICVEI